ncbi:MAG: lysylphosphatidylglycerol synthase transmembrane domain-containing protein [Dehalococcoidia bacterium]
MKSLQPWVGAAISAGFLYFAFRGVDLAAVGDGVLHANYLWLACGLLLASLSLTLRARRWQTLFAGRRRPRFARLFGVLNVGYLVNDILPLRAGELVRALLLGQLEPISRVQILSTIVLERAVDTVAVIAMLGAVAPFVGLPRGAGRPLLLLTVAMLLLFLVMLVAAVRRDRTMRLVTRAARFLPERLRGMAVEHADSVIDGFSVLTRPLAAAEVVGLTILVYLLAAASMEAVLLSFHIQIGKAGPFFLLATATLGLVVPSSPGAIGVWEGTVVAVLTEIFGVTKGLAATVALVSHVVFFLPPVLFAAVYLWRSSASLKQVLSLGHGRATVPAVRVAED